MSYSYKYNPISDSFDLVGGGASPAIGLNRIVFKQTFTGTGSQTQFQLTGTENTTFIEDTSWSNVRILNTFPSYITKTNKKAIYDSLNIFTRNRITVSSINASGLVTLDYAPRDSEQFIIWYWYELADTDVIDDYYREDFITEMEGEKPDLVAGDIPIEDSGAIITATEVETALQENRTAIDLNTTHSQLVTGNPHSVTVDQLDLATGTVASDLDDAITKKHEHSNKALLDTYTQTEVDLASAVSLKHSNSLDHIQNTDTILLTGGSGGEELFNAGLLKTNLIPDVSNTHEIGSQTFRIKKIWIGGGSIALGTQLIQENAEDNGIDVGNRLHVQAEAGVAGSLCLHTGTVPLVNPDAYKLWIDNSGKIWKLLPDATTAPSEVNHLLIEADENDLVTLPGNLLLADAKYIQTDAIYARDGDGLKLYDDGGNGIFVEDGGYVGIGTTTPQSTLSINGSISHKITTVNSSTYSLLSTDNILHVTYTSTGTVTITLPSAQALSGRTIKIKDAVGNANTYNITIDVESGVTIDGVADFVIDVDYGSIMIYSDGTNWFTI